MFKTIPNFESYEIDEKGIIRESENKKIILPFTQNGYYSVTLKKRKSYPDFNNQTERGINSYVLEKISVHQLLGKTFLEYKEEDKEIIHINGLKKDNRIENLKWITAQEKSNIKKEKDKVKAEIRLRLMEKFSVLETSWYDKLIPSLLVIQAKKSKYQFGIQTEQYELRNDCLQEIMEDIYEIVKKFYFEKRDIQL